MKPTFKNLIKLAYSNSRDKSLGQRVEVLYELLGKDTNIRCFKNDTVLKVISSLKARGLTGATINRYLSILSKVVAIYRRSYNPSFAIYIPWQQEGSGRFEYLKQQDEANVISQMSPDLALVVKVLLVTGMRLGELLSIELTQIDGDWVRLWQTKTNRPRSVPLPAGVGEQLRALVTKGMPKGHTIRRGLRDALRASGVNSNITPHSLRHTTATRLVRNGTNLIVAGKYLGHNSLKTTQRYVHIEDSDIREAMDRMT
jgi:integrase